jgi:hypothetical protein
LFLFEQFESGAADSLVFGPKLRFFELFVIASRGQHSAIVSVRVGLGSGFAHECKREAVA